MNRLHNLDYLRGIAAFGIMVYHYFNWGIIQLTADTFLGRIGLYGVSVFYILSGLTLFIVYSQKMQSGSFSLKSFFIKRIFRIFPLLWLATLLSILLTREIPDIYKIVINMTGLFGFFDWNNHFATGVWSIGNELTFYAIFPILLYSSHKKKTVFYIILSVSFILYCYFAYYLLNNQFSLNKNWHLYTNPFNQAFLFILGIILAKIFSKVSMHNVLSFSFIVVGALILIFLPTSELRNNIVTSENRLIFTLCAGFVCLGFFKIKATLPDIWHNIFSFLGGVSYSLYLLHPICYSIIGALSTLLKIELDPIIKITISTVFTLFLSYVVYEKFEKYFIGKGKVILKQTSSHKI